MQWKKDHMRHSKSGVHKKSVHPHQAEELPGVPCTLRTSYREIINKPFIINKTSRNISYESDQKITERFLREKAGRELPGGSRKSIYNATYMRETLNRS